MLKLHDDFGTFSSMKDSLRLGNLFIDANLLRGFTRLPDEQVRHKYPRKLQPNQHLVIMGEKDFYMWNIQKDSKRQLVYVMILIISVIIIILFPMWPHIIKLGIFYILFYFLVGMVILIIVRYIVYIIVWLAGAEFWIFPNLFDDSRGLL